MKKLSWLLFVLSLASCRQSTSSNAANNTALIEAAVCEDYVGPLRVIAYGRTLAGYHACLVDEAKVSALSRSGGNDNLTAAEAEGIARDVIDNSVPIYSEGSDVRTEKLPLEDGYVYLVYFSKHFPSSDGQAREEQSYVSMVIPVYVDGSFQLPEGL